MSFKGKTVVITGGSGGIGSETARLLASRGANIAVNFYSSPEKAKRIVHDVKKK